MATERELDTDQRAVIDALRESLKASGLTQRDFALALGTSPSRLSAYLHGDTAPSAPFLMKCQRLGAAFGAARRESVPTPIECGTSLRVALATQQRPSSILRIVLEMRDRLRDTLEHRPHLLDVWDARVRVADRQWDTLIAAIVEHEFGAAGLTAPSWSRSEPLTEEWLPAPGRQSENEVRRLTPVWLKEKRILIAQPALDVA